MAEPQVDPDIALAELTLDRIDGTRDAAPPVDVTPEPASFDDRDGLRIGDAEVTLSSEADEGLRDPYLDTHADEDVTEAVDAFNEAFNARDLDTVLDLVADDLECPGLGNDRDNFGECLDDLWDRRPNSLLTRGRLDDGRCCAVMWEPATHGGWWRVGIVLFDDVDDGVIGVVEMNDDQILLDEVETDGPDGDAEEGTRWEEWADGEVD